MKVLVILLVLIGFFLPVTYADSENSTVAEIRWSEAAYSSDDGTKATVIVTDHDMNKHPNVIDYIWIEVYSDSDMNGFRTTLFETDFDSGIFEGNVVFVKDSSSGKGFIHISDGDTITAKYVDKDFPSDYVSESRNIVVTENKIEMSATAIAMSTGHPFERVPATNFRLLDIAKNPIMNNVISVDQQVRLVSDLKNQMEQSQPFAYIVQIQNSQNQVESLSWIAGNLTAYQKLTSGVTWIPAKEGVYHATVFVWESIDNPTALSPPLPMEIQVKSN